MKSSNKYSRQEYDKRIMLYMRQRWLSHKENELNSLLRVCKSNEEKELLYSLLSNFIYLTGEDLGVLLEEAAGYIIDKTGFVEDKTQLLSITYDDEADSSQKTLDQIKVTLWKKGWKNFKTVNKFGSCVANCKKGFSQIIIIDEFIGSGQTLSGRLKQIENDLKGHDHEIKCCFLVGMEFAIKQFIEDGFDVFCPLKLKKGISENYSGCDLSQAIGNMMSLEGNLAVKINEKDLADYSFGYNKTEALCSMEGCQGNTPNNVFPIFWWPLDHKQGIRRTLLTRYERGF